MLEKKCIHLAVQTFSTRFSGFKGFPANPVGPGGLLSSAQSVSQSASQPVCQSARPKRPRTKRANNDKWLFSYIQINTPTLPQPPAPSPAGRVAASGRAGRGIMQLFCANKCSGEGTWGPCLCHCHCHRHCLLPISNHPWRAETESRLSGRGALSEGRKQEAGNRCLSDTSTAFDYLACRRRIKAAGERSGGREKPCEKENHIGYMIAPGAERMPQDEASEHWAVYILTRTKAAN